MNSALYNFAALITDAAIIYNAANQTISYLNAAAENSLGLSAANWLGKPALALSEKIHPADEENWKSHICNTQKMHQEAFAVRFITDKNESLLTNIRAQKVNEWEIALVINISPEQKTLENLERNEKLLNKIIESSLDMIQVFEAVRDDAGKIIDFRWILINETSERIFGNVVGKSLLTENPGVKQAGIFDAFCKVVETGIPDQSERHYAHEQFDGWFYQSAVKLKDGVATTTRDITEKKNAILELKNTRDILQSTLDSTFYIIQAFKAVRDNTGNIVDFVWVMNNRAAVKQNGNVIGESLLKKNPGVVETGLFEKFVAVVETGIPIDHEFYYNYEQFNGWFHQTLVKSDDGFVMCMEDITARKNAVQEIIRLKDEIAKRADDKYQTLFNSIDEGLSIIELIYDDNGKALDYRFIESNAIFTQQTGLPSIVGKTVLEVFPNLDYAYIEQYEQVAKTGVPVRFETCVEAMDEMWFTIFASRIGSPGSRLVAVIFDNITERKRSEHAIDESEERFRTLVTATSQQVYKMSADWKYMYHLAGKNFLADTSDVESLWIEKYIPEMERERVQKAIDKAIENKKTFELEHQVFDAEGNISWVYSRAIPMFNNKGKIIEWIGAGRDITERKIAELALHESEERKSFLLRLGEALSPLTDPVAIEETANRVALDYFQSDRCYYCRIDGDKGIINRDAALAGLPSVAGVYDLDSVPILKQVIDVGKPFVVQDVASSHIIDEDIRQLCIALQVISFVDIPVIKEGKVIGLFCVVQSTPREWTELEVALAQEASEYIWAAVERAKAENALYASQQELRKLNENLEALVAERTEALRKEIQFSSNITETFPDMISIMEYPSFKIEYMNRDIFNDYDFDPEELENFDSEERKQIIHPDDLNKLSRYFKGFKNLKEHGILTAEYRAKNNSGIWLWYRARGKVFEYDDKGKPKSIINIIQNITALKKAESSLIKSEKLETAYSFARTIAHEVRNPLTTVNLSLAMLKTESKKAGLEKLDNYVTVITRNVKRVDQLITQLLYSTRRSESIFTKVNICTLLDEALKEAADRIEIADIEVQKKYLSSCNVNVEVETITIAFLSIIMNAIEATAPKKGKVTISTEVRGLECIITISDNGNGIKPALLKRIFEPFYTTKKEGMGLGLTNTKTIVERNHGKISVQSELGQGTSFIIVLPVYDI